MQDDCKTCEGEGAIDLESNRPIACVECGLLPPPEVLSLDPNSPVFHPCYVRVGLRIDGVERNDIAYYNVRNKSYKTARDTSHLAETIEPYWRYQPSRQQRRAEERWKGPRK